MQDINISASLESAKFTARHHPDKPDVTIRRLEFKLVCYDFGHELAEWLGPDAIKLRDQLQERTLSQFKMCIGNYHAKVSFSGIHGHAKADIDGIAAVASVKGKEQNEHEELALTFEMPIEAKVLTFIGASFGETIGCDFEAVQLELGVEAADGIKRAVADFAATMPKGTSATFTFEGKTGATVEGTGQTDDDEVDNG
jgi:hypothetical protein